MDVHVQDHGRLATGSDVAVLQKELSKKQLELQQLQESYDEFTLSSQELEQELEQELNRSEARNATLLAKVQRLELDLGDVREKLDATQHEMRKCETELSALRAELQRVTAIKRRLEQEQDELSTQVRILQATEDDLRHKMEREMEEKVFLLSDQDELKKEHELVTERLRTEILDLKSELFAVQQKNEALEMAVDDMEQRHSMGGRSDVEHGDTEGLPRLSTLQERDESDREQLIETLERELDVLSARLQEETDTRERLELEVLEAQDSLAQAEAMENEMTEMSDELIEKSQEIRQRDLEIQGLREDVTFLQMENAALLEENAELREAVESNGREDESMEQAEKNEDDEEMEWLRSQRGQLEATEQQLREQLAEEQEVTTQLREENVELVKQIEADARMRQQVEAQLDAQVKQKQKEVEELTELNASLRQQLAAAAEKTEALEEEHKKAVAAAAASAAAAPVGSPSAASTASSSSTSTNGVEATANDAEIKRLTVELHALRSTVQSLQAENTRLRNAEASSSSSASTQLLLPSKRVSTDLLKLNYTPDQLADKYLAERTRNAALLSRLQTVCGNIQVFCRVRPVIGEELAKSQGSRLGVNVVNQSDVAAMDVRPERIFPSGADGMQAADADDGDLEDMMLDVNAAWKVFTFDRVLGPEETQLDVFREVEPIAQSVVEGFKACIFTYGQTGSGKTYTMEGTPSDPGLNYRVLSHIFQSVVLRGPIYDPDRMEEEDMVDTELLEDGDELRPVRATNEVCYHIQVGVLEIYNESLRDLVDPTNGKPLEIRQDPTTGDIVVPHLTMATASSPEKTIEILRTAQTNRVTGKTDVHAHSSRSHSIVILQISTRTSSTPSSQNDSDETASMGSYVSGKLYMVDLAGSERVKKSNVSGAMLKEAAHINKSLSALADVMEALDKKHAHVPYRNSKLTYLLQDVLNTSCKTVMIVNCGPTIECASETFRSLQLAERVRNIVVGRNSIVKNKKDILSAKRAFSEIQSLKQQIQRSERKIKQSQQTVVAMKRDQKHQSDHAVTALQSRLKAAETQAANLKTQADTMKRINEELNQQVKQEREAKQKEVDQRDAAQRALRQLTSKTRVSSSHQEMLEKQLKDREDEVKKLRLLLTEARQRTATSVIPRHKGSTPAPAKKQRGNTDDPASNQDDTEMTEDDAEEQPPAPRSAPTASRTSNPSTKIPTTRFGFSRQSSSSASTRKLTTATKSTDGSASGVSKFRRPLSSSSSQASTSGGSSVQRRGWK